MQYSATEVIEKYLQLRRRKEEIERRAKEEVAEVKGKMEILENYILSVLNEMGADNIKVQGVGTAYLSTKDFVSVQDGAALREHILTSGDLELLNMAANKTAVREYMARNGGHLPPGVAMRTEREVVIRKA